jgi:hypothetical protein
MLCDALRGRMPGLCVEYIQIAYLLDFINYLWHSKSTLPCVITTKFRSAHDLDKSWHR